MSAKRLNGKVAVITGASRGIGAALALAFAEEGAAVVVNYHASAAEADGIVNQIRASGGKAVACAADTGDVAQHGALINGALREFGHLDILVNNAAIDKRVPAIDAYESDWDRVLAVDLKGPYFLAQQAARAMDAQRGGAILNISSVHDERAHRNNSLYTIAKGGLKLMTRCLALEWAERNIRVNALCPGAILTDMNRNILKDAEYHERTLEKIPLRRIGEATELAGAALLLVSNEGSYITGSTFYVDGGLLL